MDRTINNKRTVARTRKPQTNRYVSRSRTSRARRDSGDEQFKFDIKLISIQQVIITLFIFIAFLITYFLPMESAKNYVTRISTYVSDDIELNEVYENLNSYVDKINSSVGFLKNNE